MGSAAEARSLRGVHEHAALAEAFPALRIWREVEQGACWDAPSMSPVGVRLERQGDLFDDAALEGLAPPYRDAVPA